MLSLRLLLLLLLLLLPYVWEPPHANIVAAVAVAGPHVTSKTTSWQPQYIKLLQKL